MTFSSVGRVGIIGYGHLGMALAEALLRHGFPKDRMMISYGGNQSTLEHIKNNGLLDNIASNVEISARCDTVFIALRPQAFGALRELKFSGQSMVISCMAGIPLSSLKKALGVDVYRIMPGGPEAIKEGKNGIVAMFPYNDGLKDLLASMGLTVYTMTNEASMHYFTVGVCLPAAIIVAKERGIEMDDAIREVTKDYKDFSLINSWAMKIIPDISSEAESEEYVRKIATKGGVTEAIVDSLNSGSTFLDAIRSGIIRSKEISDKYASL
jgi:pyrroline-5-carboxylate reductase